MDAAGGVFGAAAFGVVEGFGVGVEVFFGPGGFELAFVGPFDAIPAVAAVGREFGHGEELAYHKEHYERLERVTSGVTELDVLHGCA